MPSEFGLGHPLEYAIYWSPITFISTLIKAGSNPNYPDHAGFPSIIAALSTQRSDKLEIVKVLIEHGADPNERGVNDWTPLHYAVAAQDAAAIGQLLAAGAAPSLRTGIDQFTTALEEAENTGFHAGAAMLRDVMTQRGNGSDGK